MNDDIEQLKKDVKHLHECLKIQARINQSDDELWTRQLEINQLINERLEALRGKKNE